MAGRGRGLTLPAWMTVGNKAAASGAPAPAATVGAPAPPPRIGAMPAPPPRLASAAQATAAGGMQPPARPASLPGPPRSAMPPPPIAALPKPVWSQHMTPDGRPYFYNAMTKKSTFQKPTELMTPQERRTMEADTTTEWREHRNPNGRVYYSNVKTRETTWTMPEAMRKAREAAGLILPGMSRPPPPHAGGPMVARMTGPPTAPVKKLPLPATRAAAPPVAVATPIGGDGGSVSRAPGSIGSAQPSSAPNTESISVFNALLESVGVTIDSTWESTMRQIITDKRYAVLRSLSEKKNAFNKYIEALAEKQKERIKETKDAYIALLERQEDSIRAGAGFRELVPQIDVEPEFVRAKEVLGLRAVEDETHTFIRGIERKQRERERETKREHADAFRQALRAQAWVRFDTSWRHAAEYFFSENTAEVRSVLDMDRGDAVGIFEEYIDELAAKEKERQREERDVRRIEERDNREAFCALLLSQRKKGALHARSRWKDFVEAFKEDPVYIALSKNVSGSTPRELFTDIVGELYDEYRDHKARIRAVMKIQECEMSPETSLEAFKMMLQRGKDGICATVSEANLKFVWADEVDKAKERMDKEEGEVIEEDAVIEEPIAQRKRRRR